MHNSTNTTRFRFWLFSVRVIGVIVPRRLRSDWRQEWEAELHHREVLLAEPERLVEFLNRYPGDPAVNAFSRNSYEHFRDNNRTLAGITGVASTRFSVKADGAEPELVEGEYVIGNFFQLLGLKPTLGRLIEP